MVFKSKQIPSRDIPPKGTKARDVIEWLFDNVADNSGRNQDAIRMGLGDISTFALRNVLSAGRKNGWLIVRGRNGFALSSTAHKQVAAERLAVLENNRVYSMKPISKQYIPSRLGMREGSNDYLAWPSKHV